MKGSILDLRFSRTSALWVYSSGLILMLVFGYSGAAWAHGGGTPQLTNTDIGPYWISVWTQPDPLRVGETHFSIALAEPPASEAAQTEAGPPVLGATVELQLQAADGTGETLVTLATHAAAVNKLFYETDLDLPAAGQWQVLISVAGPAGSGQTSFEVEVLPPSSFPGWTLFGGVGLILAESLPGHVYSFEYLFCSIAAGG